MRRLVPVLFAASLAALNLPSHGGEPIPPTFTEMGATVLGGASYNARSASLGDIDNDMYPDLLFQGASGARQLFRNTTGDNATPGFTNVTATHGPVAADTEGWSAAWADYDGDGRVDVFLGQTNPNPARGDLFRNTWPAGFVNVSASTINDPGFHQSVAWGDANNDGLLDLFIAMEGPERHELYLQQGDGSFLQQGLAVGLQVPFGTKAYGLAIGDFDGDGDIDLYVSTCRTGGNIRNNFFENRLIPDGTLAFVDIADDNGTQYLDNSYAAHFVDFDDDGLLDLFVVGADRNNSKLWRNNGDGTWTDVETILGGPLLSTNGGDFNGASVIDYDNDGDLDLFFHDHLAQGGSNIARALFRNDGNWIFTDVTAQEGLLATNEGAYDSVWGDIDLDGDLDLVAPTGSSIPERVFVSNANTNGNNWLFVHLRGRAPNTRAVGAQLYATINEGTPQERTLRRDANPNAGAFAQNDLPVHFGLGAAEQVDTLRIVWPGGKQQVLRDVAPNRHLVVEIEEHEYWMLQ